MSLDWRTIEGWFNEGDAAMYAQMVSEADQNGRIVEVGSWMGRSTGALIEQCKWQNKDLDIICVDTFKGSPDEPEHQDTVKKNGGSVRHIFDANVKQFDWPRLAVIQRDSLTAARMFRPNSLEGVMIDGCHANEVVRADIRVWFPRVKPRRYIGGHDYSMPSVHDAVHACIPRPIQQVADCWLCLK